LPATRTRDPFLERVELPTKAMVPPHTHPKTENTTVLAGSFGIGEGTVADRSKLGRNWP
jgi:quercetin dioxygenase-like cupin family protein